MPSERFHKLKQVKKRTFLRMAYKEFALHSYEAASITRLVSELKMAKGSIYQYFKDKEDMYNYLVVHAYDQLYLILTRACPLSDSSFDSWYKNYLLVYLKFLCTIPSYASLMIRDKVEFPIKNVANEEQIFTMITKSSNYSLSKEREFFLRELPLIIYRHLLESENIDINEKIESDISLDISSDKLLYLCEAFLGRD